MFYCSCFFGISYIIHIRIRIDWHVWISVWKASNTVSIGFSDLFFKDAHAHKPTAAQQVTLGSLGILPSGGSKDQLKDLDFQRAVKSWKRKPKQFDENHLTLVTQSLFRKQKTLNLNHNRSCRCFFGFFRKLNCVFPPLPLYRWDYPTPHGMAIFCMKRLSCTRSCTIHYSVCHQWGWMSKQRNNVVLMSIKRGIII